MKQGNPNEKTADEPFQQIGRSPDPRDILDAQQEETPQMDPDSPSVRTQEHMRRLAVGGLWETDPHRSAKTEYVMRLLVSGRVPLGEPPAPAVPEPPPEPAPPAVPEPYPRPSRRTEPEPPQGGMTLENLTFDDLLAELENL